MLNSRRSNLGPLFAHQLTPKRLDSLISQPHFVPKVVIIALLRCATFKWVVVLAAFPPSPSETTMHTNNWAVLVSTSRYWFNYRDMANSPILFGRLESQGKMLSWTQIKSFFFFLKKKRKKIVLIFTLIPIWAAHFSLPRLCLNKNKNPIVVRSVLFSTRMGITNPNAVRT